MNRSHFHAAGAELDADLRAFSPDPCGRLRLYKGGGGGGAPKYDNLEALYKEQTASARLLRDQAEQYLPGATSAYMDKVGQVTSPGYVEQQSGMAAADMASANAMERAATERDLASMGVNPNDPRFAGSLRGLETSGAARMAAGKNLARNDAQKYQLAVAQDAVGTFTGQSNSAATQMNGATSGLANLYNAQTAQKQAAQAQQSQNVANAVGGGIAAASLFLKDGGKVCGPSLKMLERHNGFLGSGSVGSQQATQQGFFPINEVAAPPATPTQPQQPAGNQALQTFAQVRRAGQAFKGGNMAEKGAAATDKMATVADKFGAHDLGRELGSRAAGQRMASDPQQAKAAVDAYRSAAETAKASGDTAAASQYEGVANGIEAEAGTGATAEAGGAAAGEAAAGGVTDAAGTAGVAQGVSGEVAGMASGAGAAGAEAGAAGTTAATTSSLASAAPGVSAAVGEAASGLGAAGATAGTAGAAAGTSALGAGMAAVGAAMPWVGAALAVGSLLGAFKDGGEVKDTTDGDSDVEGATDTNDNPTQDLRNGSSVEGPGSHTADIVPALLSNKEHVENAEAAALAGHDRLEKLNKAGLKLRKQGVPLKDIKQLGLKDLMGVMA